MKLFILGLVIGLTWSDIKWLTYDILVAVLKGVYHALRIVLFAELNAEASRWKLVKRLPKITWYEIKRYVKWEWWMGCKITR